MREIVNVVARAAGLVLVVCSTGCHLAFGDFEAVEQGTGGSPGAGGSASTCGENEFRCQGAVLERCTDGSWIAAETCAQTAYCLAAEGRCLECKAGDVRCQGSELQNCNDTGDGWTTETTCPADLVCDEVAGRCMLCKTGSARCTEDLSALEVCNSTGWGTDVCDKGCIDDPGDCDYCLGCSQEGVWRCTDCGKVQFCEGGSWHVTEDCGRPDRCVVESSRGYCI